METGEFAIQLGTGELGPVRDAADLTRAECYATFRCSPLHLVEYFGDGACARAADNAKLTAAVERIRSGLTNELPLKYPAAAPAMVRTRKNGAHPLAPLSPAPWDPNVADNRRGNRKWERIVA